MFKSQLSGKVYGPKISPNRTVVLTRNVEYVRDGKVVATGVETVQEILVGPDEVVEDLKVLEGITQRRI